MKKIYTLLAAALLAAGAAQADNLVGEGQAISVSENCVTSLDNLETGLYAILANPNDNPSYLYQNTTDHTINYNTGQYNSGVRNNTYVFKITVEDAQNHTVKIQAYDGYYLQSTKNVVQNEAEGTTYTVAIQGTGNIQGTQKAVTRLQFKYNNGSNYLNMINNATGSGGWGQYAIFPVTVGTQVAVNWTINYTDVAGTAKTVQYQQTAVYTADGANTVTCNASYPFTTLSNNTYTLTAEDAANGTANAIATATFNTPFEASASYADANWYFVKNVQNGTYLYYSADAQNTPFGSSPSFSAKEYQWAFIGNPIDGYQVVNNQAGDALYMYYDNPSATAQRPYMQSTQQNPAWTLYAGNTVWSSAQANMFSLGYNGWYWNHQTTLSFWNGNGNGNAFTVEEVPDVWNTLQTAYDKAVKYNLGNSLGQYQGDTEAFTSARKTAQDLLDKRTETDENVIDNAATALTTAMAGLTLNMPTDYSYIRLKSVASGKYLCSGAPGATVAATLTETSDESDPSTIWYYHEGVSSDNKGFLLSYLSGEYLQPEGTNLGTSITTANTGFKIGASGNVVGAYNAWIPQSGWRYLTGTDGTFSMQNNPPYKDDTQCAWTLENVATLPVAMHQSGDKYYATLSLPKSCRFVGTAKAYGVTAVADGSATLTEVETSTHPLLGTYQEVAANQPIVIISESSESVTVAVSNNEGHTVAGNLLTATGPTARAMENGTNFYFGQLNGNAGFYQVNLSEAKYIVNKAYLSADQVSPAQAKDGGFTFKIDNATTGISSVDANAENNVGAAVRYNLAGQRVGNNFKGVVIQNGKKMLVK